MKHRPLATLVTLCLSVSLVAACGVGRGGDNNTNARKNIILIGTSLPHSGPLSVYGNYGLAMKAWFEHVNEEGGVNGRSIELISYDDASEPSRTLQNVRRLNEQDNVLAVVGIIGTGPNLAVMDYATSAKLPMLFLMAGTAALSADPKKNKYTVPILPPYPIEGAAFGEYLRKKDPEATVAILRREDDAGTDFLKGFEDAIKGSNIKVVAEQSAPTDAPTVQTQMNNLEQSRADVFLNINAPKQASQAISFFGTSTWKPLHYVASYSSSIESALKPAGLEASRGILTSQYVKDPADPQFVGDSGVVEYMKVMQKYAPKLNAKDVPTVVSGIVAAQLLVAALSKMEDPSRENLMKAVESLTDVTTPMLLPGISVTVSASDHSAVDCVQLQQFNGQRYELIGDVICGK